MRNLSYTIVGCLLALILSGHSNAQLPTAELARLEPRAAHAGQSLEVNLIGKHLDQLSELRFTHSGITATPVMFAADEVYPAPRHDGLKFSVTVAADVPPGIYEARSVGFFGYTTARPFVVVASDAIEVAETGNNDRTETAMELQLNSVVSGSVASRGIDWFKLKGSADKTIVIEVQAERIDSRLDSQLVLYDTSGVEIKRDRDTYGRDSLLKIPPVADAEYYIALSDILYRGGGEYFYRLRVHDQPHVDFVFPPAVQPGFTTTHTLVGCNLPTNTSEVQLSVPDSIDRSQFLAVRPRCAVLPRFDFRYQNAAPIRVGIATAPIVVEQDGESLQKVELPCEVAGRFDDDNDEDTFRFSARKGQTICIETIADRMGVSVDPLLVLHRIDVNNEGTESLVQIVENDDLPSFFSVDGKDSIDADTNDAALTFKSEHDADYQVTIVNQLGSGGPASMYRLAIREPVPDFQLIASTERPLATNRAGFSVTPHLRRGGKWGVRIVCPRQDEFAGDIVITAEGLPPGVKAKPLTLRGKTDQGILVISADREAKSWAGDIRIVGRSKVAEQEIVREARFACLVWGHIFSDSIRVRSRTTQRVPLSITDQEETPVIIAPAEDKTWEVAVGQNLEIPIQVTDTGSRSGNLTIEPRGLFGMLRSPPTVNVAQGESEAKLTINFTRNGNFLVQPGVYQFALHGTGVAKYQHNVLAVENLEQEKQRVAKLLTQISAELEKAKATSNKDVIAAVEARFMRAEQAAKEIAKRLASAQQISAEKNINFSAWSDLITVVVTDPKSS